MPILFTTFDKSKSHSLTQFIRIRITRPMNPPQHNFEKNLLKCKWSPDGAMVAAGSADRFVYVWDTATRRILYKLPGHLGSVNDVDFHLIEPIGRMIVLGLFLYLISFVHVPSSFQCCPHQATSLFTWGSLSRNLDVWRVRTFNYSYVYN